MIFAAPVQRGMIAGLLVVIAGSAGCSESPQPTFSTRDSAGVQIMESLAAQWPDSSAWRLSASPVLEIGETEGEPAYLFSRIAGALRLQDGTIVVADGATNQLRFFGPDGRYQRAVGREGRGPGEFEYIRALDRCGSDGITAFDLHWQLKVFSLAGVLIREAPLQEPGSGRSPYALSCSLEGRFVVTGWGLQSAQPQIGLYTATAPVYVLDSNGAQVIQIGEFISSERIGDEHGSRPHPFGKSTMLAIAADAIYVGTSDAFEVQVYGMDGKLRGIVRGPQVNLEIRPEHLDRYLEQQLAIARPEVRPALERALREMPLTAQFPAYSELRLDPQGNLWVRRFLRPGEDYTKWAVFSPEGAFLGDVQTPKSMKVFDIGADYLLGVLRDEMNVERVRLYRLEKPAP